MKRIHILLGIQSIIGILVSLNRLGPWTLGYVLPNQFLRWVDLNNILLSLASLVALYLLKKTIEYDSPVREGRYAPGLESCLYRWCISHSRQLRRSRE